ncbi:MAG TPA: hydrogenase iron-sulfur subunit [Gemmatimonadales bacterium]|nr:hydrogenase iron-sulfur subunit [Gemmatimonadales bacterium]
MADASLAHRLMTAMRRPLALADAGLNRLYGWRGNPLYQSGTIAVAMLLVLIASGLWLLLLYRVGAPWASVARLTEQRWTGNWVRGLHRYASDAALVATAVHALRLLLQRRRWGPRTLAWLSGLLLTGVMLLLGWTGFVMVWDGFGQQLALEGARVLDALPVLSEPVSRAFAGDRPVPTAFFFLNLFIHVALPLLLGLLLWLHVSRVARAVLLPPRALLWGTIGALTLAAVAWPLDMAPAADALTLPAAVPADWFYAFWMPVTRELSPGAVWALAIALGAGLASIPWLTRPRGQRRPPPSVVDRQLCTGCDQCVQDCPYDAIRLEPRTDGRPTLVARVDPARCVSCGICSASCAPMGVGPAGRTGRDQLEQIRAAMSGVEAETGRIVVFACRHGPGALAPALTDAGAQVRLVDCAGNLHTSTVEFALRRGAAGALILSCPPRDCRNREGPAWLEQRLYHEREAELKARVDRRRLRVAYVGAAEGVEARAAFAELEASVAGLARPLAEAAPDLDEACETSPREAP